LIDIYVNFKVLQQEIIHVIECQVVRWGILVLDALENRVSYAVELDKPGSASLIEHHVLTHPPPVTAAIDQTCAVEGQVLRIVKCPKVYVILSVA